MPEIELWECKAHRIIRKLSEESYNQANVNPRTKRLYKRHRPYAVPALVQGLCDALGKGPEGEEQAKALFLTYEGLKAIA